jgi:hypothetical protein
MGDLPPWLQWLASPAVIGLIVGWFNRRRIGSWLAAQRNLMTCRSERDDLLASLVRTRVDAAAERASRDQERAYLQAAIASLTQQGERVATAHREGRLSPSETSPTAPSPSPASSPPSPPRRRRPTRSASGRPRRGTNGNGTKKGATHDDETPAPVGPLP